MLAFLGRGKTSRILHLVRSFSTNKHETLGENPQTRTSPFGEGPEGLGTLPSLTATAATGAAPPEHIIVSPPPTTPFPMEACCSCPKNGFATPIPPIPAAAAIPIRPAAVAGLAATAGLNIPIAAIWGGRPIAAAMGFGTADAWVAAMVASQFATRLLFWTMACWAACCAAVAAAAAGLCTGLGTCEHCEGGWLLAEAAVGAGCIVATAGDAVGAAAGAMTWAGDFLLSSGVLSCGAAAAASCMPAMPPLPSSWLRAAKSMDSSPSFFCFSCALALVKKITLRCSSSTRTFFLRRDSRAALRFDSRRARRFASSSSAFLGFFSGGGAAAAAAATSYPAAKLSSALRLATTAASVTASLTLLMFRCR
mmetsp:Transcript_24767/g.52780  ORF Transcript_24767/g.52780 Transcript_24767/m.52780 type:complete len:366 (+) Transcript_24767:223-1320(+)